MNLSTMGSVAAAAAGVKIVKHGNRAASSKCGAADVLEDLGLPLDLKPEPSAKWATRWHHLRVRPHLPPGHALRGPDSCRARHSVRLQHPGTVDQPRQPGTRGHRLRQPQGEPDHGCRLRQRGQSGLVYTSHEGMDELAPTGPVSVWEIRDGKVTETEFDPTVDLGLAKITVDQLKGGVPDVNANAFKDFLAGKDITSRTTALLNAASAIVADGNLVGNGTLAERFAEAYKLAEDAVDSGKAEALFNKWIETAKSKA